jgi:transposase
MELAQRRLLAVERLGEGYSVEEVAEFLGIDPSSVRRWRATFGRHGATGLAPRPVSGRPPKLTATQEKVVRRWLTESPTAYGFPTALWTGPRLAQLIREHFDVTLHPQYLCAWLRARGFSPQKPQDQARERDPESIARWLAMDWPRIKKRPADGRRRLC